MPIWLGPPALAKVSSCDYGQHTRSDMECDARLDLTYIKSLSYKKSCTNNPQGRSIEMQIHGLQSAQAVQSVNRPNTAKTASPVESAPSVHASSADLLDLSSEAQQVSLSQVASSAGDSSGIRTDRVAAIRQAIADGTYESPEKLSTALDRLLDIIG